MNSDQLKYLIAIGKEKTMADAAEKLFVTPQALSIAVKKLEEELQMPLLSRSSTGTTLTENGSWLVLAPGLPLQAASTARLFSTTDEGRGAFTSFFWAGAPGEDRLIYSYGEDSKAFSASSRVSNDLYFAPS